jgi:hypothetical protein
VPAADAPVAEELQRDAHGDPMEPSGHGRAQSGGVAGKKDEAVLRDVFRVGGISDDAPAGCENHIAVLFDERPKSIGIPGPCVSREQFAFPDTHRCPHIQASHH